LLVESLNEIQNQLLIEKSPEQQIGPVDHIDHKRLISSSLRRESFDQGLYGRGVDYNIE